MHLPGHGIIKTPIKYERLSLLYYACGRIEHTAGICPMVAGPQAFVPMAWPFSGDLHADTESRMRVLPNCSDLLIGSPAYEVAEIDNHVNPIVASSTQRSYGQSQGILDMDTRKA